MSIPKPGELAARREFSSAAFRRGGDFQASYLPCFKQRPLGNRFLLTIDSLSKHALALPSLGFTTCLPTENGQFEDPEYLE